MEVTGEKQNQSENLAERQNDLHLSLFLLTAQPVLGKRQSLRLLALFLNYDFLLITENWLSDDALKDALAVTG